MADQVSQVKISDASQPSDSYTFVTVSWGLGSVRPTKREETMFDLLFNLPIPVINISLGLGTGTTKINSTSSELGTDWKTGSPTQFLASVGYNILPLIDLHLSYRMVSSHTITRISSSSIKAGLGGSVTGIGVKIGF